MSGPELIYSADGCEVWCGDSVLYPYAPGEFDHVVTDPPYSPNVHKSAATMQGGKARKNDLKFDHLSPLLQASIAQRITLAGSWSVAFTDTEATGDWKRVITASGGEYVRTVPWVRWSMPQLSGDRPPQGSESVMLAHPGGKKDRWNGPGNLTHFDHKCLRGKDKHPTEKPLDLMLALISYFTEPGARVIDPCGGIGTTALACSILGRRCVVIERERQWADGIAVRLSSPLSARDASGLQAYRERMERDAETKERVAGHTKKIRNRREDK